MSILNIKDANGNFIPVKALNGKTPVKGVDYFTESDIQDIIDRVGGETGGSISFPISVFNGGTGATDAATARTNLDITPANIGAAPATHNQSASTITSGTLSANRLPTVPVTKGGTGATDAATARANLNAQENLGFTPVQQGGGTDQGSNKVYIGWAADSSGLRATVDKTDLGYIITNYSGTTLSIHNGGTGATTAAAARTNLEITPANIGAAPASHNQSASTITSGTLSADRLPTITVAKGGTGATDAATARSNLGITPANIGAAPTSHTHDSLVNSTVSLVAGIDGNVTPTITGKINNLPKWAIGGYTADLNHLVIHRYSSSGAWAGANVILDSGNYGNYATPANIGAAPATHNQSASTITSGTLSTDRLPTIPVTKGGTGATDAATARSNLNAQENLGFTPIQQGGGTDQRANKVYIGWSGSQLLAQVDSTNLGNFVFGNNVSRVNLLHNGASVSSGSVINIGTGAEGYKYLVTTVDSEPCIFHVTGDGGIACTKYVNNNDCFILYGIKINSYSDGNISFGTVRLCQIDANGIRTLGNTSVVLGPIYGFK